MAKKQEFYERYEVEEYYIYDPDRNDLNGFQRIEERFVVIDEYDSDGQKFLTPVEMAAERQQAQAQLDEERSRTQKLVEHLRSLGVDPESL